MPWLKLLHIVALVAWSGALLYLPTAIAAGTTRHGGEIFARPHDGLARVLFTAVATPAALVAIASGTAAFAADGLFAGWLAAKLGLVSVLVLCHAWCGVLLLRVERDRRVVVDRRCALLRALSLLVIVAIAGLVLAKPF